MPSPFPGMNPWLELASAWESFHPMFIPIALTHLTRQLGEDYVVRVENRLYIHEPSGEQRFRGKGDFGIFHPEGSERGGTAVAAPHYVTLLDVVDIERVNYLTIRDVSGNELITVVELLSPTNKYSGPDREQYIGKRNEILRSKAHLVEIDLLRGGPRMPSRDLPECDYCVLVSRVEERPKAGTWHWRVRDPMPRIPVPVRAPDPDVWLDLKAIVDQVYDAGRFSKYAYDGLPEPRLSPDDMAWAAQFLPISTPSLRPE